MTKRPKRPRTRSPASVAVYAAAAKLGAIVERAGEKRWYVTVPVGKAWAVDDEGHVLMILDDHPDDLAMGLDWIAKGLVDCPDPECEWCRREELAAEAEMEKRRAGMDSAML